jgi:multimeric flavodoxin WrbA
MASILAEIEGSDAIVLGSPVNFGTVTAVMKKFIERLVCFAYWPWGMNAPKVRNKEMRKRAVVVVSSAAPSLLTRLMTRTSGLLKKAAGLMGARTVGVLHIGLSSREKKQQLPKRTREKARHLGKKLDSHNMSHVKT